MDYEKILEKARKELPESVLKSERFEIPKVKGHIQGNKTIITNFNQIASKLRREADQILKYILKEIAAPGEMKENGSVIIGRKVSSILINEKIEKYANEYVICPECNKPDTQLMKESNNLFKRCLACGAKNPIRGKIQ